MSSEEMKKREEKINTMCICRSCPTYQALGEEDDYIGYCFQNHGRSKKIVKETGCYCGTCPVYEMYRFMTNYYCTRGLETEQKRAIIVESQTGKSALELLRG